MASAHKGAGAVNVNSPAHSSSMHGNPLDGQDNARAADEQAQYAVENPRPGSAEQADHKFCLAMVHEPVPVHDSADKGKKTAGDDEKRQEALHGDPRGLGSGLINCKK